MCDSLGFLGIKLNNEVGYWALNAVKSCLYIRLVLPYLKRKKQLFVFNVIVGEVHKKPGF